MGLACKIVRTDSGVLALNEQGKVSNLYLDLLSFFQNDEKALNFWALTHTDEFKTAFGGRSDNMSVEDVVAFANAVQIEESELSPSERHEVKSIMESNNIGDLQQLSNTLNNIFKPNGFIDLDIDAAIESGMYNQEDLKNINLTEINSLLNKIEGDLQKGRNFTVVPSQDDVAVIDETKKTILGTSFQLSRTDIDNDIIPRIESFTPDVIEEAIQNSEFQTYVDKFNTDEEFKNKEIERFSKLSSVPVLSFIGDQITDENISYHDQLLNTIPAEFDIVDIESDLDFIEEIPAENWVNNPNEIINVLREVEQTLAKNNIDLVGLSNLYNNREQVLSLITPLKNMIRNTNDVTILEFARAHDTVFPPSENRLVRVIPEKYKGLNVVSLNTRKTDAELYREHGLIKLEEGLYHKVQRMDNTMAAYEYLYRQLVDGKMTIPSQYITVKDYKNPSNKVEVLKGITNYVNARETGITSEFQEEISLYQLVFDHNPIQKQDFRKLSTIRTNEEYLKGDFVADFYNYVLNEKLNDTPMYREVLSKFKFTNADIVIDGYISSLDGINMQQELEDYLKLKNGTSYEFLFNNGEGYLLEDFEAVNNPESVQPYKGEIVKDGDYVITNPQSDMFVNYDGQLYRKVGKSLNADLYLKISEVSRPVYNTAEANFEYNREEARAMLDAYQNGIDSQKISFQEFNERLEKAETSPTAVLFQRDTAEKVEATPKIITDAVLTKLQETGLANKVFAMTSEEINAKLEEIGLTEEVRKQIIAWHGTQNPAKNLKKKDFKNQIKYGDLLSGTYFGNKTIAAGFSGIFQGSTLFKAKIDEAGFETIDMKKTTPMGTEELIEVIGQERYDDLLAKKNSGEIKGIILENTYEKNYPIGTTTQYLVFDPQTITVLDKYVGDRLEEEVMDSFGIAYDPKNLSFSTESLTVTPNGFVYNGDVYLNTDNPRILNTQIHEFGHLFNFWAKENRPNLYRKGIQLVQEQGQEYIDKVKESQPNLEGERLYEEALTQLIGDKGELIVNKERKSVIGQWLTDLWNSIKNALGITQYTAEELENITLEEFAEAIAVDMLKGTKFQTSEYTIQPLLDEMFAKKKGKMVNVQTINQILNQPTTKAIEKEIIREVLNLEGFRGKTQIPFDEFKGEVNARIMPLDVIESNTYSGYGSSNVGVDVGFSSTNIYNSKLDHQIDGHFKRDFDQSYYRRNLDGIEFNIYSVYEANGSEMHYVLDYSVEPGFKITPENKDGKAYFISPSLEMANNWIENYNKTRKINSGQFGHTRVWREAGTKDVYVAEIQSDSYQNAKAVDMVLTNYKNNPQDLNSKQKPIYKKIKETEKLIDDFDSSDLGTKEYKVKELYNYISKTIKSINEDKQVIKNLKKSIEEAKQDNRAFYAIDNQLYIVEDILNRKEIEVKSYMQLIIGDKIEPIYLKKESLSYSYVLPYQIISSFKSLISDSVQYRLQNVEEIFTSLEDAVSYYEKNILPRIKPDKQLSTKYFNAKKDLPNLKNSLLDNASLRDKQFIAHRKNYTERLLREEIKRNAELGMETLAIPTPRTLALIESYVSAEVNTQDFSIKDVKEEYQGIVKRYEKTIDFFKKERGENIEIITDSKGNEWVRTKLTSEDAISPVIAFQIEMPSVKNIPNIISNKKSDIATTIESSFEMLTPTEEETRNKVECQS